MPKPRGRRKKELKPVLHIFCEGQKTEPNYLDGYVSTFHPGNRRLQVIRIEKTLKNTPVQLIEEAIERKSNNTTPKHDAFWVVYDRESISKYPDELHRKALDKANGKNINVVISNVCFEVWLLLHFTDVTAPYSCFTNLIKESPLKAKLKKIGINKYDKADKELFNKISNNITQARTRAKKMNALTLQSSQKSKKNPHLLNPYTTMHLLLDAIDEFVEDSQSNE